MAISMLKIRRPLGRLIFNMGIAIPGKTVFLIETAPCCPRWPPRTAVNSVITINITYVHMSPTKPDDMLWGKFDRSGHIKMIEIPNCFFCLFVVFYVADAMIIFWFEMNVSASVFVMPRQSIGTNANTYACHQQYCFWNTGDLIARFW